MDIKVVASSAGSNIWDVLMKKLNTQTGDELLRASIGQIFYFEDRRVSLDGTVDTANQSDIIAELGSNIGRWQGNIQLQLDTTYSELSQEHYFLHYQGDSRTIFNLGYRKRLDNRLLDIEQTDTSFVCENPKNEHTKNKM